MIRLKSISISNYRSFGKTQHVEFPEHGLLLIKAEPFNGSLSGIGKSNLFTAINYGVTQGEIKDNTKHWFADQGEKISIDVELWVNSDIWLIKRGTFTSELFINGKKSQGGAKVINQMLREVLGMDFDLINLLTYRRQRRRNPFVSASDSEKKEFLSRVLGLEEIDDLIKISSDTIRKIDTLVEQEQVTYKNLTNELSTIKKPELVNENKHEYLIIQLEKYDALFNKANSELESKNKLLLDLELEKKTKLEELAMVERPYKKEIDDLDGLIKELNQKIQKENETLKIITQSYLDAKNADKTSKELKVKLNVLKQAKCYVCDRFWDEALIQAENVQAELDLNLSVASKIEFYAAQMTQVESDINKLKTARENANSEKSVYLSKISEFVKNGKLSIENDFNQKKSELKIDVIQKGISDLKQLIFDLKLQIKEIENAYNVFQSKLMSYQENVDKINEKISKSQSNIDKYQHAMATEEDFKELIGRKGFLGFVISEILQEVSFSVSRLLAQIPNTSEISVRIVPVHEGITSVKPKISFLVYKRGMEIDLNDLSGGQQASLELAMDLALSKIIFNRLNVNLGWIIFDEALHGLSAVDKEAFFEIFKIESADKLIMVVDHDANFESFFDKILYMKFDGQATSIRE